MPDSYEGTVISRFGSEILFETGVGLTHRGKVRRKLSDIVCGDRILYHQTPTKDYAVTEILPRKNTLVRQYFRGTPRNIAANIDQVLLVIAPLPKTDWQMIDNLLVTVKLLPADAIIIHNKSDLEETEDNLAILKELRGLGYSVVDTSMQNPDSIANLAEYLKNKVSVLIGQSGVGKTTITNVLIPELAAPTRPVSESSDLGQHTTSAATLYSIPQGGKIIDSPGIRDFTPIPHEKGTYQHGFVEFTEFNGQCKFHNCLHRSEPHCAVKQALEDGKITQRRYESYLALTA